MFVEKDENGNITACYARPQYEGQEFIEGAVVAKTWNQIRIERGEYLTEADFKINKLEDKGEDASAWRTYRQKLRDITDKYESPDAVKWPEKPS